MKLEVEELNILSAAYQDFFFLFVPFFASWPFLKGSSSF